MPAKGQFTVTERDREIVKAIAGGEKKSSVAKRYGLSISTVEKIWGRRNGAPRY